MFDCTRADNETGNSRKQIGLHAKTGPLNSRKKITNWASSGERHKYTQNLSLNLSYFPNDLPHLCPTSRRDGMAESHLTNKDVYLVTMLS